jgi:hypothetical protein
VACGLLRMLVVGRGMSPPPQILPIKGEEEKAKSGPVFPLPRGEGIKGRVGSSPLAGSQQKG